MIYMWKEERGKPYYRFQTDERAIANKMKRRKKFTLIGWGENCNLWIYKAEFKRPDIARKIMKSIAGNEVNFNQDDEIYYCITNVSDLKRKVA